MLRAMDAYKNVVRGGGLKLKGGKKKKNKKRGLDAAALVELAPAPRGCASQGSEAIPDRGGSRALLSTASLSGLVLGCIEPDLLQIK